MSAVPLPAPLPLDRFDLLDRLTDGLGSDALWWLSGYAAALARSRHSGTVEVAPPAASTRVSIVYGSQTGNARRAAERAAARLRDASVDVRLVNAADYPLRDLKSESALLVVISTQGDGDPPDDARGFVDHVLGARAPKLDGLRFGVLGLGDSSYPQFCAVARRLDARLEELGATRWLDRADADLDIDEVASPWIDAAHAAARDLAPVLPVATVTPIRAAAAAAAAHDRDAPFAAPVLAVQRITARGAARDVRHVELSLEGSGLTYQPGDALGVWPINPLPLVDEIIATLGLDGDADVDAKGRTLTLRDWLLREREITRLSKPLIARHAERARSHELDALLAPGREVEAARLLDNMQLADLLSRYPAAWSAADLVAALRPLAPRLYSIASSPLSVGDEAHLTVVHVEYETDGRTRWGTASHLLTGLGDGDAARVFVEPNARFRLPKDGTRDVLMIGAGTGVAPFRGFVQHRTAEGAIGRNWLLFGAPHARTDFLYQLEWQRARARGALHRLDVAFSRDQAQKIYVQQRLREHGRDVHAWLEGGAHLYVCGAVAMSKDVHDALIDIIATHGGRSRDDASARLDALLAEGRYARDVY